MAQLASFDSFARDNLPPREQWPDLLLDGLDYPEQLNCVAVLLDQHIAAGHGDRPCLASPTETWSYADVLARVNRIANVLTHQLGMIPGNRVLLRAPNTPLMVAAWLAVMKAGGIAVATMPLLRTRHHHRQGAYRSRAMRSSAAGRFAGGATRPCGIEDCRDGRLGCR